MGCIQIFKTKKNYIIITLYKTESWTYIIGNPVFLLPLDVPLDFFIKTVIDALKMSRSISESEEKAIRIYQKGLLKDLKEKSFNELYKKSKSCNIYLDDLKISIEPNIYISSDEGLVNIEEKNTKMSFIEENYNDIIKIIIDNL